MMSRFQRFIRKGGRATPFAEHMTYSHENSTRRPVSAGAKRKLLYDPKDPRVERDACGVGFVASANGDPAEILAHALCCTNRLAHRGATGGDGATGDGAGILTQIPHELFAPELARLGAQSERGAYGVGVFFLPRASQPLEQSRELIEAAARSRVLAFLGWRAVPVQPSVLGRWAEESRPEIVHAFFGRPAGESTELGFDRRLFELRRLIEAKAIERELDLYVASLS
ncbi:MAG TPA: hypothetical protein VFK80_01770, partial [Limnochordia bacterium]|nr:hypothetical protein [Limnochordia bacterium]